MDRENQKKQEENRVKRFCKCREEGGKVEMTHKVLSVLMIFVLGGFMGNIFQHDFHTEELYVFLVSDYFWKAYGQKFYRQEVT